MKDYVLRYMLRFLQGVSIACFAMQKPCLSYRKSVRPSVCHTVTLRRKLGSGNLHCHDSRCTSLVTRLLVNDVKQKCGKM